MKRVAALAVTSLVMGLFLIPAPALSAPPGPPPGPPPGGDGDVVSVDCATDTIQDAVDDAVGPTTIFIEGSCVEDVSITMDDIILSGAPEGGACDPDNPGFGGGGSAGATINGTVTVDGVRAKIIQLEITGSGHGVVVTNRADARLTCNNISGNDGSGASVIRSSSAFLQDNTLNENGQQQIDDPFVHFDVGLFVGNASSVRSEGNTYKDNEYAGVEVDRQGAFRNGDFLPREGGHPNLARKDTIIQKGGDFGDASTCTTTTFGPVAVATFNSGLVDLRNANVCGEVDNEVNSSFRIEEGGSLIGTVFNFAGSFVRIRSRENFDPARTMTFEGTLRCGGFSGTFGSRVQCGQICFGTIKDGPGATTCRQPQCSDGTSDNDADTLVDDLDPGCHEGDNLANPYDPFDDDESSG